MAFEGLTQRLQQAFGKVRGKGSLTEEDVKLVMREVRMALLEADVNYKVVKDFVKKATERCIGQEAQNGLSTQQQVIKIVNEELTELMGGSNARLQYSSSPISVFMLCGLQGAGKTTMSAKLANWLKKDGKRPLLVGCDIYRPAAIKQLQVVGGQVGVPVYEHGTQDPVKTAQEAIEYARQHQRDVVILDTAGRLHIDEALMEELHRICEAVHPSEILLTIDAMTGQDAVNVANTFNEKLEITGVILTKLDGDTRGGAALSVRAVTGKPIKFAGTGEKLTDLEAFHPERMASRILGMGDVMTLIEKAQENIDIDPEQAGDLARADEERRLYARRFPQPDAADQEDGPAFRHPQDAAGHERHRRYRHSGRRDEEAGGHHPLHDAQGAQASRNPQRQPPPQNRGGQRHDGAGRQPAHPPIRRDEEADEDGYEPVARQEGAFPLPADALKTQGSRQSFD